MDSNKKKTKKSRKNKFHILSRYNIVLTVFVAIALANIYCLVRTVVVQGPKWNEKASKVLLETNLTTPLRGRILSDNGTILAANIQYYKAYIDWQAEGFAKKKFQENIDKLCDSLEIFGRKQGKNISAKEWKKILLEKHCGVDARTMARKNKRLEQNKDTAKIRDRYHILFDKLSLAEYRRMRTFPFLKDKKAYTGFNYTTYEVRQRPLAATTLNHSVGLVQEKKVGREKQRYVGDSIITHIDSVYEKHGASGLEGALDHFLYGVPGKTRKEQISNAIINWEIEPSRSGYDVVTTINIDIQDILEKELESVCQEHNAEWGTAVIMEVKTGKIKGLTNICYNKTSHKYEASQYQYAMSGVEPGSLMKVISMTLALEKGLVRNVNEVITTGKSFAYGKAKPITDSHAYSSMPVHQVIPSSSNIGMAKIILRGYEKEPWKFQEDLAKMGFFDRLNTGISSERPPVFPKLGDRNWHRVALTRMAYGYSTNIPPIYTLAFFNALANDGKFVRPHLVDHFMYDNKIDSVIETSYIREQVCSPENARKLRAMMHDVVWDNKNGTGRLAQDPYVKIAGKTGTSYVVEGKNYTSKRRLAFCGFFPYDNPQYTCIVVIQGVGGGAGAARVSGKVLKNTALKMYAKGLLGDNSDYNENNDKAERKATLHHSTKKANVNSLSSVGINQPRVASKPATKVDTIMPNVIGLPAREAIAILEKKGFAVEIEGSGVVVGQKYIPCTDTLTQEHKIKLKLGLYF